MNEPVKPWSMYSCWAVSKAWAKIRNHKNMDHEVTRNFRVSHGGIRIARKNK
jgi:hypothetical protein